jgi:hypothetical protein
MLDLESLPKLLPSGLLMRQRKLVELKEQKVPQVPEVESKEKAKEADTGKPEVILIVKKIKGPSQ